MPLDLEKFRLRRFVEKLGALGEVETHDEPVALGALAALIENSPKVTHFRAVGAERFEMVAGVNASPGAARRRFRGRRERAALGVSLPLAPPAAGRRNIIERCASAPAHRHRRRARSHPPALLPAARIRRRRRSPGARSKKRRSTSSTSICRPPQPGCIMRGSRSARTRREHSRREGRAAIAALLKLPLVKHVFIADDDIDIRAEAEMEWAFATRFRADRDIVTEAGHFAMSMDPTGRERQDG